MGTFRFQVAVSLDGYVAGPDQSEENPLGVGGLDLHQWVFQLEAWRNQLENVGDLKLQQVRAIEAPGVTHLKYRVVKGLSDRPG